MAFSSPNIPAIALGSADNSRTAIAISLAQMELSSYVRISLTMTGLKRASTFAGTYLHTLGPECA
ncbi:MAG: hypothetical protein WA419_17080 [Silvibacterium sp.]